jgi:hypothetical protein
MKEDEIKKFWDEFEKGIGEKVQARALAEYISGIEEVPPNLWGLLVASESALRFEHNAQDSWLRKLIGGWGGEGRSHSFIIPRVDIKSIKGRIEKNFFRRLFLPIRDGVEVETVFPGARRGTVFFILEGEKIGKFVEECIRCFGLEPDVASD